MNRSSNRTKDSLKITMLLVTYHEFSLKQKSHFPTIIYVMIYLSFMKASEENDSQL